MVLDSLARLAELVGYHCRKPARKRVLALDLTKARPRRSSDRAHEPSGDADVCAE